jgi:hypothetical protein
MVESVRIKREEIYRASKTTNQATKRCNKGRKGPRLVGRKDLLELDKCPERNSAPNCEYHKHRASCQKFPDVVGGRLRFHVRRSLFCDLLQELQRLTLASLRTRSAVTARSRVASRPFVAIPRKTISSLAPPSARFAKPAT